MVLEYMSVNEVYLIVKRLRIQTPKPVNASINDKKPRCQIGPFAAKMADGQNP